MPHDHHDDDADGLVNGAKERPAGLTKNETMVWDVLDASSEPLKAYQVLDQLKFRGVRAPMTVYRALDGLVGKGFVHKLDALNAFMICMHDHPHDIQAFMVCSECPSVIEFEIDQAHAGFQLAMRRTGFNMRSARLEVHGVCPACTGAAPAP